MKTTIEVDDDLFRQAKILAAQRGITLKELVQMGLQMAIAVEGAPARGTRIKFPLIGSRDPKQRLTSESVYRAMNEADEEEAHENARLLRRSTSSWRWSTAVTNTIALSRSGSIPCRMAVS